VVCPVRGHDPGPEVHKVYLTCGPGDTTLRSPPVRGQVPERTLTTHHVSCHVIGEVDVHVSVAVGVLAPSGSALLQAAAADLKPKLAKNA
jgi:hypothetical protein